MTNSDNFQRRGDVPFSHPGSGMVHRFRCGDCDKPSLPTGCGVRFVNGLRQKVCEQCKVKIDARKADRKVAA
jgi:hypothetical protein